MTDITAPTHLCKAIQKVCGCLGSTQASDRIAPPRRITDDEERNIWLLEYTDTLESLVRFYESFDSTLGPMGTPPDNKPAIYEWLERVLVGVSVLAWHEDRVIGHIMFVPDSAKRHELAIFVHQHYQRAGIGTELLQTGLCHAKSQGIETVWLHVEPGKGGLQKLYREAGFSRNNINGSPRVMTQSLS